MVVSNEQVGCIVQLRTVAALSRVRHFQDSGFSHGLLLQTGQARSQFLLQSAQLLTSSHNSARFASFAIDEDSGQAEGESPGSVPVNVFEPIPAGRLARQQLQVSLP